ncbi:MULTISPECIES: carbohydrate ABC transporter permease [unclassified Oceanispirochaeta]|uniref:carbohydrate ABC transporter permease n=1 Tax=unclassified Oceanispirochaeta TaxID=2635722 RepID=UPI000E08DE50|nr:sugar ABC transporter permease [Oceanispirochaeta sp. M1]MBF9016992.1 sugar ABC transporter permease [Oceanispirochaeta sp. M2]NPD73355.1 sugar ABC transporter permease [Oceanispirochaeta sp. M1]RDG31013.1 sugar ABC transporter permease [Oceanispirochaeta sp. M1]
MQKNTAWQFLLLPLLIYSTIIIFPFLQSLYLSLTNWNGLSPEFDFIGLANYKRVFTDPNFSGAIMHNLIWVSIFLVVPTSMGLFLAVLLDKGIPGATFFKSVIYLPMIFSYVIIGMIWNFVYEPRLGILNLFIRMLGYPEWNYAWLAQAKTALPAIILEASWQHTGLCMILYLAGLSGVRQDLLEAARIDGANSFQLFFHIVIPQLKNSTIVVISLTVINSLKNFDLVYISTKGGPFRSSEVLTTFMYRESFWNYQMGYGSTIASVLFFIVFIVVFFYFNSVMKEEKSE